MVAKSLKRKKIKPLKKHYKQHKWWKIKKHKYVIKVFIGLGIVILLSIFLKLYIAKKTTDIKGDEIFLPPDVNEVLLPGQQTWRYGVSSYIFGTNDAFNYSSASDHNKPPEFFDTDSGIQQILKNHKFTLMRVFFFDREKYWLPYDPVTNPAPTDSELDARIDPIFAAGMNCLAVIYNINNTTPNDLSFAKRLVTHVTKKGNRCLMFEFGNEPHNQNITPTQYQALWDKDIPVLRAANPSAKFIGPATSISGSSTSVVSAELVAFINGIKKSGVIPDALSFHAYGCNSFSMTQAQCLANAKNYEPYLNNLRSLTKNTLGYTLPIGVTEWNATPLNPLPAFANPYTNPTFIQQYTNTALESMICGKAAFANQFSSANGLFGKDLFDVYDGNPLTTTVEFTSLTQYINLYYPTSTTPTNLDCLKSQITPTPTPVKKPTPTPTTKLLPTPTLTPTQGPTPSGAPNRPADSCLDQGGYRTYLSECSSEYLCNGSSCVAGCSKNPSACAGGCNTSTGKCNNAPGSAYPFGPTPTIPPSSCLDQGGYRNYNEECSNLYLCGGSSCTAGCSHNASACAGGCNTSTGKCNSSPNGPHPLNQ